ncbi:hypothetical protein B0H66DRAFT_607218 [Apodospora peruviana]|uniref:Uncharacterized protein n=1 Tax=Apodospora peruviana TaxID=516989 RepID=A0AAE0M034_9PEZI|nr:hypothetical protein B0H66DRAFT_607218 [Apodospora peruviana]
MKEGEEAWVEETGHYGVETKEVAERAAEDVRNGRWMRLGVDSLHEAPPAVGT